jgi:hypothetical protein
LRRQSGIVGTGSSKKLFLLILCIKGELNPQQVEQFLLEKEEEVYYTDAVPQLEQSVYYI